MTVPRIQSRSSLARLGAAKASLNRSRMNDEGFLARAEDQRRGIGLDRAVAQRLRGEPRERLADQRFEPLEGGLGGLASALVPASPHTQQVDEGDDHRQELRSAALALDHVHFEADLDGRREALHRGEHRLALRRRAA